MARGSNAIKIENIQDLSRHLQIQDSGEILNDIKFNTFYSTKTELKGLKNLIGSDQINNETKRLIQQFINEKNEQFEKKLLDKDFNIDNEDISNEDENEIQQKIKDLVNEQNALVNGISINGTVDSQREALEVFDDGVGVLVAVLNILSEGQTINLTDYSQFKQFYRQNISGLHPSMQIVGNKYIDIMENGSQELKDHLNGVVEISQEETSTQLTGGIGNFLENCWEDSPGYSMATIGFGLAGLFMVGKKLFGKKNNEGGGGSSGDGKKWGWRIFFGSLLGLGFVASKNTDFKELIKKYTGWDMDQNGFGKFLQHPFKTTFAKTYGIDMDASSVEYESGGGVKEMIRFIKGQNFEIDVGEALFSGGDFFYDSKIKPGKISEDVLGLIGSTSANKFMNNDKLKLFLQGIGVHFSDDIRAIVYMTQYLKVREKQRINNCFGDKIEIVVETSRGTTTNQKYSLPDGFTCRRGGALIPMTGTVEDALLKIKEFQDKNPGFIPSKMGNEPFVINDTFLSGRESQGAAQSQSAPATAAVAQQPAPATPSSN